MSDSNATLAKRLAEIEAERWAWARPTAPPDTDLADAAKSCGAATQTRELTEFYLRQYESEQLVSFEV